MKKLCINVREFPESFKLTNKMNKLYIEV